MRKEEKEDKLKEASEEEEAKNWEKEAKKGNEELYEHFCKNVKQKYPFDPEECNFENLAPGELTEIFKKIGEPNTDFSETTNRIMKICDSICYVLNEKNRRYGNSIFESARVFSTLPPEEGIKIRLDDKIKRIRNSDKLRKNDTFDLIGYLILLCASKNWINFDEFLD